MAQNIQEILVPLKRLQASNCSYPHHVVVREVESVGTPLRASEKKSLLSKRRLGSAFCGHERGSVRLWRGRLPVSQDSRMGQDYIACPTGKAHVV